MSRWSPSTRLALWGAGSLLVALVHNRLWASPNLAFFTAISNSLGRNPFGNGFDGDYLLTNLLGPTVARALGQTDPHEYVRLHLLLLLLGLIGVVATAYRRHGYEVARALCVLVAASPALTVAMEWLGQPDALTLPLALGVAVASRRWAFGLAVLLGLAHAEQGLVIALVTAVVWFVLDDTPTENANDDAIQPGSSRPPTSWAAFAIPLVGVVTGRAITEIYLRVNDIVVTKPRTAYLDLGIGGFVRHHLESNGLLLVALWGPLWIGLGVLALRFVRSGAKWPAEIRRGWALLIAAGVVALVPMLLTLDETRVYSLTTAPLLVGAAVLSRRSAERVPTWRLTDLDATSASRAIAAGAVALALLPGLFTAGDAYVSYDLPVRPFARFLLDGEHPGDLTGWLLEPFGFEVPTAE